MNYFVKKEWKFGSKGFKFFCLRESKSPVEKEKKSTLGTTEKCISAVLTCITPGEKETEE